MSFPLYTVVCAGIPKAKNLGWESNRSGTGYGWVGQAEELKVIAAQIGKKKAKRESLVFDRRSARAKAQSPPPCSFYLAVGRVGFSDKKHGENARSNLNTRLNNISSNAVRGLN